MPTYNVTLKEGASKEELDKAKQQAVDSGGEVKHEFTLIKGFTVEFHKDTVSPLSSNEHVNVEVDQEVKIQD